MTGPEPLYRGGAGEPSARFRPAGQPPGYRTAKGTAGHYLAAPQDTTGRFSLYRWDMSPASGGPGPHFHRTYAETFYVLAGTIRLSTARAGSTQHSVTCSTSRRVASTASRTPPAPRRPC